MGRAPSSGDSTTGSPTGLIDVQVGEVYDNVRTVAENIDSVNTVADNLSEIINAEENLAAVQAERAAAEAAANASATSATNSQTSATAAAAARDAAQAFNQQASDNAAFASLRAADADADRIAAESAKTAAETAQAAAEQAALDAAAGAAFGTLGGVPTDNAALSAALSAKLDASQKGANNGVATLNSAGKIPNSQMPAISIIDTYSVADRPTMLALITEQGDVAVVSADTDGKARSYIRNSNAYTGTISDWFELKSPSDAVLSINGLTGAVVLGKADIGLANVDNTSDANKPISTATQSALNAKMNTSGGTFTGITTINRGTNVDDVGAELFLANGSFSIEFDCRRATGNANPMVQAGDAAIVTSKGSVNTGCIFIGPWADANRGLRIAGNGSHTLGGNLDIIGGLTVNSATVPVVAGDGGMEIGNYLDFHNPNADGADFKVRFLASATGQLNVTAAAGIFLNGVALPDVNYVIPKTAPNLGNADLNTAITSGTFRVDVPTNGPGTGFNYGPLIVARSNDTIGQMTFSYNTGEFAWRAGNPPETGGTGAWSAWDKISNYAKKSASNTFTGPITINVGATNTGLDLASNDAYLNARVQRNTNASMPGMWFGYGGAAGNLTFCPGGMATGMLLDTSNMLTVNGNIKTNGANAMFVVGTRTSNADFGIYNDSNILRFHQIGVGDKVTIDTSGNLVATGNVTAYSDARLKKDVQTVESALYKVGRMRGVTYTRKDSGADSAGVLAQELREIAPELIHGNEAEGMISVNYAGLAAYFIEAIKELKAEIAELKRDAAK